MKVLYDIVQELRKRSLYSIAKDLNELISKISDYKDLLNRSLNDLEKNIDKIYPTGKMTLILDPEEPKGIKIKIVLDNSGKVENQVVMVGRNYKITIDTSIEDKEDVYRALAHEITHVSQKMNGFFDYSFKDIYKQWSKFPKEIKKRHKFSRYRSDVGHEKSKTEQEATLVAFLVLLRKNLFDKALNLLESSSEYFKFSPNKFKSKAASLGITNEQLNKITKMVENRLDSFYKPKEGLEFGDIFVVVEDLFPIIDMLELDKKKYMKRLSGLYDKMKDKNTNSYNYKYIEEQLNG